MQSSLEGVNSYFFAVSLQLQQCHVVKETKKRPGFEKMVYNTPIFKHGPLVINGRIKHIPAHFSLACYCAKDVDVTVQRYLYIGLA